MFICAHLVQANGVVTDTPPRIGAEQDLASFSVMLVADRPSRIVLGGANDRSRTSRDPAQSCAGTERAWKCGSEQHSVVMLVLLLRRARRQRSEQVGCESAHVSCNSSTAGPPCVTGPCARAYTARAEVRMRSGPEAHRARRSLRCDRAIANAPAPPGPGLRA